MTSPSHLLQPVLFRGLLCLFLLVASLNGSEYHSEQSTASSPPSTLSHHHAAIPMISFSFNFDPSDYSSKLISSIDYPVKYLSVQIGDSDSLNIDNMYHSVSTAIAQNKHIHHSQILMKPYNPGS